MIYNVTFKSFWKVSVRKKMNEEGIKRHMEKEKSFLIETGKIAVPVTLQVMLQSSFSIVDQIMIGQLGSVSIAGIGLVGKFTSIFNVLTAAIASVAGIMIAQYIGKKEEREVGRSFYVNLFVAMAVAAVFTVICLLFPGQILDIYTKDPETKVVAEGYMRIVALGYFPIVGGSLLSTVLRCMEKASLPMYASFAAVILNTVLNYILIFGKCGVTPLGVNGAAVATIVAQTVNFVVILLLYLKHSHSQGQRLYFGVQLGAAGKQQYLAMLLPVLLNEFLWSMGENVYAAIYGRMGTADCAAMTLTNPIQGLMIGALSGISQAAGIIIGKELGRKEYDRAYRESKKLMFYGLCGSAVLSLLLFVLNPLYVSIYQVEDAVKLTAQQVLIAFAIISPVKVQNMILGGGILRSGGKTNYILAIDLIGTWCVGVPVGLLTAFVWKLPIPYVYFLLSLEECVRLAISLAVFKRRGWMQSFASTDAG